MCLIHLRKNWVHVCDFVRRGVVVWCHVALCGTYYDALLSFVALCGALYRGPQRRYLFTEHLVVFQVLYSVVWRSVASCGALFGKRNMSWSRYKKLSTAHLFLKGYTGAEKAFQAIHYLTQNFNSSPLGGTKALVSAHYVWERVLAALKFLLVSAERERAQNHWAWAQISAHFCAQNGVLFANF